MNETYVEILEHTRLHKDNAVSEAFLFNNGVRQGDPIFSKLFTRTIIKFFKEVELKIFFILSQICRGRGLHDGDNKGDRKTAKQSDND